MIRLFTAVDLEQKHKQEFTRCFEEYPDFPWSPPENLHITLNFLGEVNVYQYRQVRQQLKAIDFDSFSIRFKEINVFHNENKKILWLGVEQNEALESLQQKIKDQLEPMLGGLEEREFIPHITLARIHPESTDELTQVKQHAAQLEGLEQYVDSFTLFTSKISYNGSVYTQLETYTAPRTLYDGVL